MIGTQTPARSALDKRRVAARVSASKRSAPRWGEGSVASKPYFGRRGTETEICVVPDFASSGRFEDFGQVEVSSVEEGAFLLRASIGLRATLAVDLESPLKGMGCKSVGDLPSDLLEDIAEAAFDAYELGVSDRVVELMAMRSAVGFAWYFLDAQGSVESASAAAAAFCASTLGCLKGEDCSLPPRVVEYIGQIIETWRPSLENGEDQCLAFAITAESGVAHCLLRSVGTSGFLLSICDDWQ